VTFVVEHKVPTSGREYGSVWVRQGEESLNVKESMVNEGLVEVRRTGVKPNEELNKLIELEESAKANGKGKWSSDSPEKHIREVIWLSEKSAVEQFVARNQGSEIDGVIEYVRDAGTMRVELFPSHQYITLMLSGVKTPLFKQEGEKQVPEPFAEEAKFFVESRLLQRDVKVLLEGVSGQNVVGSILHPAGNITEVLLREGFARCVDWSMAIVSRDRDKLRAAEKVAKEGRRRIWHGYVAPTGSVLTDSKEFTGKVVEVINADAVVIKKADGELKKVYLSSLRPPRKEKDDTSEGTQGNRGSGRLLYDVPYMFEAREFLRKKVIGKKVSQKCTYDNNSPEAVCVVYI
jgi:staphylococcal nuclease domain-containing protein 1